MFGTCKFMPSDQLCRQQQITLCMLRVLFQYLTDGHFCFIVTVTVSLQLGNAKPSMNLPSITFKRLLQQVQCLIEAFVCFWRGQAKLSALLNQTSCQGIACRIRAIGLGYG